MVLSMLLVPSQNKNSFCTVCAREYLSMLMYIQFRGSTTTTTTIILITHKNYIIFIIIIFFWLSVYDEAALEVREIERISYTYNFCVFLVIFDCASALKFFNKDSEIKNARTTPRKTVKLLSPPL